MTNGGGMHTQQSSGTTATKDKPQTAEATVRPAPQPPREGGKKEAEAGTDSAKP